MTRLPVIVAIVAGVAWLAAPAYAQAPVTKLSGAKISEQIPRTIAPAKPVVSPAVGPRSDTGASPAPAAARATNARSVSVSARQAAEQTIAALVAAMKNMPKRPPAPPEPRTPRARRSESTPGGQAHEAPTPILYKVTWPATPEEPFVGRRVELDWPGRSSGSVSLHWNEPPPE